MITIFTGQPGAGKTAALVDLLDRELRGRPLFVHFDESERLRPEQKLLAETLQIPHTRCHASKWHDELPDGAVLVVDEAQGVWRAAGPASKVPAAIQALETHRHSGVDVFVTTQSPKLVNSAFRALVGRHVHIRDTGWMGRWWYEWPECNPELAWARCQNKRRYTLPKRVFGLYRSSNEHTKVPRKIPPLVYGLAVAVVGIVGLGVNMWRTHGKTEAPSMVPSALAAKPATQAASVPPEKAFIDDRVDFLPRISNKPESAPAYDEVRRVINMPLVSGGVCFRGECRCLTQQGTDAGLSDRECREWMQRRPFDPYTQQERPIASRAGSASVSTQSAQVQTASAPSESANVVPLPSGVSNPHAEARGPLLLPPGSPVQPALSMDGQLPIAPPSLLSPYRRS